MYVNQALVLDDLVLRRPTAADCRALHQLVSDDNVLDHNSLLCNLQQCSHFADTSVVASKEGRLVGFISAYRLPTQVRNLYIWQLMVAADWRGWGLGKRMLHWLLEQPSCEDICEVSAAIGPENTNTWKLFRSFARECGALPQKAPLFGGDDQVDGKQQSKYLLSISPLPNRAPLKSMARHLDEMRATSRRFLR